MDSLAFLRFRPVPVKSRRDGWSPALQRRFVVNLARGMGPSEAARSVGRSRQTAYALREKPGAGGFAAAWDAAVDFAREMRAAPKPLGFSQRAIDLVLVPRFYRGRLVGFVQREDLAGAMRRLNLLDRMAERLEALNPDSPSFDEMLETMAGKSVAKADEADAMALANALPGSVLAGLRHSRGETLG